MKTFELKEEHLKLLKNVWIEWENGEFGAPCIDTKRPYGNSDVEYDIAKILDWAMVNDELTDYQYITAQKLHKETQTALQIILSNLTFELGVYENYNEYDSTKWRLIK